MKQIFKAQARASHARDISRLEQQVQHFDIDYVEVIDNERILSVRRKWRLFSETPKAAALL